MTKAVLIAGPTASGKSALAIALAQRFNGVVINADSMQVYADLRIITARPSPEEEASAPHRLFGHVDGGTNHSVARHVADIAALLPVLSASGQLPVIVGGTGMYFRALTDGLSDIPVVPDAVREEVRAFCLTRDAPELHAELTRRDPVTAATLRPSDRLRIMRALEVHAATGQSLNSFHGARQPGPLADYDLVKLFLAPERELVRSRIDARFLQMMQAGALDEVQALAARKLDPLLPVMRAHGVPWLIAHLRGETTLANAIMRGQGDTRAYAKRQMTWFRNQMSGWQAITPEQALAASQDAVEKLLES
ncbi:MAG: tRNA (adenosine(37)-N6)-dimethylallyltransferase MiaA [Bosea sp. (in: a-proteobacteria)]